MEVTIIQIVIAAFSTVTKGLLKGLEDLEIGERAVTIQTTILLRKTRILRSPEDLRRLSSTPVKDHQLTLV